MTTYRIPVVPSVPDQKFTVSLDGTAFTLRLRWNTTAGQWFLDIRTADDETIRAGLALVSQGAVGIRCVDPRMPEGELFVFDSRRTPNDPIGLADLGDTVALSYFDAAEFSDG